ncbi:helix-turn-helix domain-containing protein [Streptomyces sp. G-G2]|uniref:helix-turn-helix domain-containing protein n=1 Tax=Streptomyces sp. G-G2 TaxID=3046201 RepID=UPI0024BB9031|nr:helix-turn-helix domain-containing protein [Streptomyces sp. G-G2]MDJ0384325.1 helix-turn-helix domain-containing protein [Streptomyces sp. G-G2]
MTTCATVGLTSRTLALLIEQETSLALLLAQLANDRAMTVESVYAASKSDPVTGVARLLEYLAESRTNPHGAGRIRWTRSGIHKVPEGALTVSGPSQADLADALGLGRTTVEKALASLRAEGVLTALPPGTRSNRYYEIADFALLRSVARSEA